MTFFTIIMSAIYLGVGFIILMKIQGYGNIMPPMRFVKDRDGDGYRLKMWVPMPDWLWYIILTILWLPYLIFYFIMILIEFKLF